MWTESFCKIVWKHFVHTEFSESNHVVHSLLLQSGSGLFKLSSVGSEDRDYSLSFFGDRNTKKHSTSSDFFKIEHHLNVQLLLLQLGLGLYKLTSVGSEDRAYSLSPFGDRNTIWQATTSSRYIEHQSNIVHSLLLQSGSGLFKLSSVGNGDRDYSLSFFGDRNTKKHSTSSDFFKSIDQLLLLQSGSGLYKLSSVGSGDKGHSLSPESRNFDGTLNNDFFLQASQSFSQNLREKRSGVIVAELRRD